VGACWGVGRARVNSAALPRRPRVRLLAALPLPTRHCAIAMALLALAVLLGGGGSPNPPTEVALELCAGLAACLWLWSARATIALPRDPALWTLAALVALLPLVQLMPLPPAMWQGLPGRSGEIAALGLIGEQDSWRAWSISPAQTLAALLALVPPLIVLGMSATLSPQDRNWLIATAAGMALLSACFGLAQLSGPDGALRFYAYSHPKGIVGFQANRNAEADVLLIGLIAIGALAGVGRSKAGSMWAILLALLLGLATLFTGSRTGIALVPLAFAGFWLAWRNGPLAPARRVEAMFLGGTVALLAVLAALLRNSPALAWVAERFDALRDGRFSLWEDGRFAMAQYWPFGSGVGTFRQAFLPAERLEAVDPSMPNRAHNDYLELMMEAGAFGAAVLAAVVALILFMAWRAWRGRPEDRTQTIFALFVLAVIGLHSNLDYPLRSMALACLAALAAGLLAAPGRLRAGARNATRAEPAASAG